MCVEYNTIYEGCKVSEDFTMCIYKIEECYVRSVPTDQNSVFTHQKRDSVQGFESLATLLVCDDFLYDCIITLDEKAV